MLELLGAGGLSGLMRSVIDSGPTLIAVLAASAVAMMVWRSFWKSDRKRGDSGVVARVSSIVVSAFTTNWQLTILGTAAALLSFAAGWRTWDGMKNFTGEPIASLLMTFGIQAVMLIIAWLIGESFALGLRTRRGGSSERAGVWGRLEPAMGGLVGALCAIGVMAAIANAFGMFDDIRGQTGTKSPLLAFADKSLYLGVGLLVLATLLLNHRSDVVQPYFQSARLIAKNAMLWVMFLLCMATGVFFSFDSFFNSIFPVSERGRAAEIRSQRQIAGVVNDIGALAFRRQAEEADHLFQSPGWANYQRSLDDLARASQGAEQEIEKFFVDRMEAHKSAMAAQQERIATAKSGQAGLASRKAVLTDELSRLKGERPALAAELAEKKNELENRAKGLDAKRVEMMAEERGAEGTLKIGQGPVFRQRKAELQQLQDAYKIQEERVRDAQKRQQVVDARVAQIEREVAAVEGDIAKLKGEAETAEQRIQVSQASKNSDNGMPKVDPARVRAAFEKAQQEFRQEPTVEKLNQLASQCTQLLGAMTSAPTTRDRVRNVDCDPKQAAEAASRVFALNAGLLTFSANCTGGAKLPTDGGTDALLVFGRKCLQDSGLPTSDSNDMAARISAIDLNRDDKAHRFVVTWNAFADGNRLAYLSLAIAIALDSLIFMAGLFGANAVRSPLTEIDHHGEMSADQLEAAIDATLAQTIDPRGTISALLGAMHPVRNVDGFASEILLDEREPLVEEMRKVLNAGSNISAVHPVGQDRNRYLVHAGFTRYLTLAQAKPWKIKVAELDRKELVNVIGVALLPTPGPQINADIVLGHMHPISDAQGFAAETTPFQIADPAEKRLVMNVLGAGTTVPGAVRRNNDDGRYFVSTDVYKTLLLMRAAAIPQFAPEAIERKFGGSRPAPHLSSVPATRLESHNVRQIEDRTPQATFSPGNIASPDRKAGGNPRAASVSLNQAHATVAPAASPAAAPATPPPLPSASPSSPRQPQSSRLASEIRAAIISHGLHPWIDQEIEIASQLLAHGRLASAMTALVARASSLGQNAGAAIQEFSALVDEAFDQLRDEHMGDPNYVQVLESEAQKLKRLMPVLVLTPAGPYEQLIEAMIRDLRTRGGILEDQVGNGRLAPSEVAQLRGLERHLYQIRQLPANAFTRDERLAAILDSYREAGDVTDTPSGNSDAPPLT